MMKIMVVEDDVMFRYAIRTILNWESHGFSIAAEAINGKHALQLIEAAEPDILLTDISMPEMNGIDLIKEARKAYPQIKIIVLSNYDDFGFVKEALKCGAEDYLLKLDLDPQALLKLMEQLKIKIADERRQAREEKFLRSNFSAIADSFLKRLLSGETANLEEIKENMGILKLKIGLANLIVMVLETGGMSRHWDDAAHLDAAALYGDKMKKIRNIIEVVTEEYENGAAADMDNGKLAVVLSFAGEKSEAKAKAGAYKIAARIRDLVKLYTGGVITAGISNTCDTIANLSIYYAQAEMALESKIYEGTGKIYSYDRIMSRRQEEGLVPETFMDAILAAVKDGTPEKVMEVLEEYFGELYKKRLHGFQLKKELFELYTMLYLTGRKQNLDFMKLDETGLLPMEAIERMDTLEQKKNYLLERFLLLNKSFCTKKTGYKKEVQKILDFIHANYMRDISLAEIAGELNFSPNYLCNFFKQETGLRLMEYINRVRIEEAKKLLKNSSLKVYEVASRVGFRNATYFSTVFKEITGIRVTDYKENI